ncbi:MAG: 50S ribosomal protein L24 [Candidatus Berkelbacteria bacterium]|nr:50S ribosomal protein L24 [Candidatus Berkelbacteria bacterium]
MKKFKIKKGDTVLVGTGKERGKTGKVVTILTKSDRAIVEGLNIYKKHAKPSKKYPQGGIMDVNSPIKIDNLTVICPGCKKASRIKMKNTGREKRRVCVKCGEVSDATL